MKTMKVKDFIPFFGYIYNSETLFYLGKEPLKIEEGMLIPTVDANTKKLFIHTYMLFEDEKYEDYDLSSDQVIFLIDDDHLNFTSNINRLTEEEAILRVREHFDDYIDNGGSPLHWLMYMIDDLSNIITNYNTRIRHKLQLNVIEWYEVALRYEKYYDDNKDRYQLFKHSDKELKNFEDLFSPIYHRFINDFLSIIKKGDTPIIDDNNNFIDRNGNKAFLGMFLRILKEQSVIQVNLTKKHSLPVSKMFGFSNSLLFNQKKSQLFIDDQQRIMREIKAIIMNAKS